MQVEAFCRLTRLSVKGIQPLTQTEIPKPGLGAIFPKTSFVWNVDDQTRLHECCGLEADSQSADPVLMATLGVHRIGEALATHCQNAGPVIARQTLTVNGALPAGEPAVAQGEVRVFDDVSSGTMMVTNFDFNDSKGKSVIEMSVSILLLDPAKRREKKKSKSGSAQARSDDVRDVNSLGTYSCTPEATLAYEAGSPPTIHNDVEIAAAAGFPKPVVQGNQIFLIIWHRFVRPNFRLPVTMDFSLARPIFWDETIEFLSVQPAGDERMRLEVRKPDGKVAMTGLVTGEPLTGATL